MTQDWYIREALPGDANALKACMESAYSIYLERMEGITLPPMVQDYELEINNYPVWVVQCENRIVGGMIMNFEEKHAFLANIAVQVEYQGLGIGGETSETRRGTGAEEKLRGVTVNYPRFAQRKRIPVPLPGLDGAKKGWNPGVHGKIAMTRN
jgi:hypothetical protein